MATATCSGSGQDDFDFELSSLLPKLRRFAHSLSHNGPDADDLTQTAIERGLRARSQWQPGTRLDSWLFKIMRNQWIDTLRSRRRCERVEVSVDRCGDLVEDPLPALEAFVGCHEALKAVEELPAEHRELIKLIGFEGFGYSEAARRLGLPIGTVASRVARARAALIERMKSPARSDDKRGSVLGRRRTVPLARSHLRRVIRRVS